MTERAPAGTLDARKIVAKQAIGFGRIADRRFKDAVRKIFIATVHDAATDERLAEFERKVGLITRFAAGADLSETTRLEKSPPFLTFVERLTRKDEPAKKLDGPLDHSRMSLPAVDPETFSEQRRRPAESKGVTQKRGESPFFV
ncbi:hypothetical protein WJ74_22595 [Burkholderia ubonensis]|uniref:hypothetical protein n=1 Tax=Burkholderia ubonensis TaxID=101571 RepID=UPI00075E29CC|nr:hypothetical protein [Burkholderia ubonensis]KVO30524.1 hypothetical protein WJ74_22595 [Burkholderia ubonensis]